MLFGAVWLSCRCAVYVCVWCSLFLCLARAALLCIVLRIIIDIASRIQYEFFHCILGSSGQFLPLPACIQHFRTCARKRCVHNFCCDVRVSVCVRCVQCVYECVLYAILGSLTLVPKRSNVCCDRVWLRSLYPLYSLSVFRWQATNVSFACTQYTYTYVPTVFFSIFRTARVESILFAHSYNLYRFRMVAAAVYYEYFSLFNYILSRRHCSRCWIYWIAFHSTL